MNKRQTKKAEKSMQKAIKALGALSRASGETSKAFSGVVKGMRKGVNLKENEA